jgi:hypothetical protein
VNKIVPTRTRKEYRIENKDEIKEYNALWKLNNKDKRKDYELEYYENNKDNLKENQKIYYETNKEKIQEYRKMTYFCSCGLEVKRCKKSQHLKTKKHIDRMAPKNE